MPTPFTSRKREMCIRDRRYPVCRGNKDRIVGFVHVKDLYTLPPDSTMEDLRIRTIQALSLIHI